MASSVSFPSHAMELFINQDTAPKASTKSLSLQKENSTSALRTYKLSKDKLQITDQTVTLLTTDNEKVTFLKRSAEEKDGKLIWQGNLQKTSKNAPKNNLTEPHLRDPVTLVRDGDNIAGTFRVNGQLYQLWPSTDNTVSVVKVDESKLNEEHDESSKQVKAAAVTCSDPGDYPGDTESPSTIRVALVTTEQSRTALKDMDLHTLKSVAFSEANQGTENSDVGITFEDAGILNAKYSEHGTFSNMLSDMRVSSGTELSQEIDKYREQHKADLVVMLAATTSSNGIGYNDATKNTAFSVIRYSSLTGTYTFAHEMGHNIGVSHELAQYNGTPKRLPCYRHGYKHESEIALERWRTIMSYNCASGNCDRLNMFSNPRYTYRGLPTGSREFEDSSRRLNERRKVVEDFYPPVN